MEAIPNATFPVLHKFIRLLQQISERWRVSPCFSNLPVFENIDHQTLPTEIWIQKVWGRTPASVF